MPDKYLALIGGVEQEVVPATTGGTATQAGQIPALDAAGRLDASIMPVGISPDVYVGNASEALAAGALVYVKSDGTVANASAASGGNAAIGFVLAAAASGAAATVYFEGRNTGLTSLTVGAAYYLSATAGGITATPIGAGAGNISQYVGHAVSATTLATEFARPIIRAA